MPYDKPFLVNADKRMALAKKDVPLFVFCTFMRVGKQHYVVKYKSPSNGYSRFYPSFCMAKHRDDEIRKYRKNFKKVIVYK